MTAQGILISFLFGAAAGLLVALIVVYYLLYKKI